MKLKVVKKIRNYSLDVNEGAKAFTAKVIKDKKLESGVHYTPIECAVETLDSLKDLSEEEEQYFLKLIADQRLHHQGTTDHAKLVTEAKAKAIEAESDDWLSYFENGVIPLEVTAPKAATKAQEARAVKTYEKLVADKAVYDEVAKQAKLYGVKIPSYQDIEEKDCLTVILAKDGAGLL